MAESGQNMDQQCEKGSASSVSEMINKQGWLSKRSRLYKRWDKRWCCLKKNELSYGVSAEVGSCQKIGLLTLYLPLKRAGYKLGLQVIVLPIYGNNPNLHKNANLRLKHYLKRSV